MSISGEKEYPTDTIELQILIPPDISDVKTRQQTVQESL
jgi:hypothetical protein